MNPKPCFHRSALQAGFIAYSEGRIDDSEYVRKMAYDFYELDLKRENNKK